MTTVMVGIVGGPRPKRLVGQQALGTARPADLAFLCSCAALKVWQTPVRVRQTSHVRTGAPPTSGRRRRGAH